VDREGRSLTIAVLFGGAHKWAFCKYVREVLITPWAMIFRPSGLANVEAPGEGMSADAARTNA
jgi:hypothetical protein